MRFENIVLDGGIDKSKYDFSAPGKTFAEIFGGTRQSKRAVSGTWGYFSVTMENCEITRYAAYEGPALYVDNNALFREGARLVTLKNTKIHHNICYGGTVMLFNDNGTYQIENCRLTENTAKAAAGAVLSNGTATVKHTDICNNAFYRFAAVDESGEPIYPEDIITVTGRDYHYLQYAGALYIGAADAVVEKCSISGNQGLYGGGVGAASPMAVTAGEKILFTDCTIANNHAECGGAIYARSNQGHGIRFRNCNIFGNSATKGGILYTTTLVPYTNDKTIINGGSVSFLFCSMAENTDTDGGSFGFYDLRMPRFAGTVELLGCLRVDGATDADATYNYTSSRADAITAGVVTEAQLAAVAAKGLTAASGSAGDISVAASVYSAWDDAYAKATAVKKIGAAVTDCGYTAPAAEEQTPAETVPARKTKKITDGEALAATETTEATVPAATEATVPAATEATAQTSAPEPEEEATGKGSPVLWLVLPILLLLIGGAVLLWYGKGRKPAAVDFASLSRQEAEELVAAKCASCGLTKKELQVAALLLVCEKRKDIAEQLVVSEDTVKTHISHIFKKTGVSSKEAFRSLCGK